MYPLLLETDSPNLMLTKVGCCTILHMNDMYLPASPLLKLETIPARSLENRRKIGEAKVYYTNGVFMETCKDVEFVRTCNLQGCVTGKNVEWCMVMDEALCVQVVPL